MDWTTYEDGLTLGKRGNDEGMIIRDEEYEGLCRITMEEDTAFSPFSITCGIYGWFFHTRFFTDKAEAVIGFEAMQPELAALVESIPLSSDPDVERKMDLVSEAIDQFVQAFP